MNESAGFYTIERSQTGAWGLMSIPDINGKRFVIIGLQGSGKTVLSRILLKTVTNSIVYDVHHEYTGFNRYLVQYKQVTHRPHDPAIAELDNFVNQVVIGTGRIRLFIMDEANRYCPNHYPLPASILQLNDDQRHYHIGFGTIARRPTQLNTDLVELAHYLFIFRLTGRNDYKFLEDIAEGLGDAVKALEDYHFIIVDPGRRFQEHPPVMENIRS